MSRSGHSGVVLGVAVAVSASGYAAGLTDKQKYCLKELCGPPQPALAEAMKQADIPAYPDSCAHGVGRGSGGYSGTFLAFDDPGTVYAWYLAHAKGWHRYVSPMYPDDDPVLYKGPAPETLSEEELAYLDLDELPTIKAVARQQRYGVCDFATEIEMDNVPAE